MKSKTFVIIDDHPLYRSGISALVREGLSLQCIGEAGSLEEGRQLLNSLEPSLAIIDISLLGESGLTLVNECKTRHPQLKILVVSMHDENLYGERALASGANGYVMKHERPEVLLDSIRHILHGKLGISENLKQRMADRL
ncbi:response regulator [Sphaerochaeta globosa]|uniref:Response regulator receiver protein n=1 Tax=Sphaerochaeta globosa (strain ATCC BAA-1886 / DSM 22777 / Buddy) TaxID=158189 RepID=F0RXG8_SPHGB|nr:response regulator transcription factor [Sphaerochaeta globosa]ADY12018.1 response regulator receiver protein [Sphaerochaeta globosa str. Buddy]